MSGYNPNRDSGEAEPRSFVEIGKGDVDGMVEESEGVPQENQRYFAQLVYGIDSSSNSVQGYNPNRDSGVADPRSYVEISKEDLQGLVEEYDFVPTATQRYFAKVVYNVGPGGGGGGGGEFTPTQVEALKELAGIKNALVGIAQANIQTFIINLETDPIEEHDINAEYKIISVEYDEDSNQYHVIPSSQIHDENYEYADYLINIPGYVCGFECYNWMNEEHTQVTPTMEKLLPKLTFDPNIGDYGKTTIFLDKTYEYDEIKKLPSGKQLLKISYIQIPKK